jgi:hypothetical protein
MLWCPDLSAVQGKLVKTRWAEMFAQPEMRDFLDPILARLRSTFDELRAENPKLPALEEIRDGFLSGEITAGFYARPGTGKAGAGILLTLKPRDQAAFSRLFGSLLHLEKLPENMPIDFGDKDDSPSLVWTAGRLLFCQPRVDLKQFLERLQDPAQRAAGMLAQNKDFVAIQEQFPAAQGLCFINTRKIIEMLTSGLKPVQKLAVGAVLDGLGPAGAAISIRDQRLFFELGLLLEQHAAVASLLDLFFSREPLPVQALRIAGPEAPYVSAVMIDWAQALPALKKFTTVLAPQAGVQIDALLAYVNQQLKFDLQKDVLENLDRAVVTAQTDTDTSVPPFFSPGTVTAIRVKNAPKIAECLRMAIDQISQAVKDGVLPSSIRVRKLLRGGAEYYYVSNPYFGGGPVFCVNGDFLLIGSSISAVRRGGEQLARPNDILINKEFQQTLARITGRPFNAERLPSTFAFASDRDSGSVTFTLTALGIYSGAALLCLLSEKASAPERQWNKDRADAKGQLDKLKWLLERRSGKLLVALAESIDVGLWPDQKFFDPYRCALGGVIDRRATGLYACTDLPWPSANFGGGPSALLLAAVALGGVGITIPVISAMQEKYQPLSSMSNLWRIGQGLQHFAAEPGREGKFPADPAELYPGHVSDVNIFVNPQFSGQPAGYIYIPGVDSKNEKLIVVYENTPPAKFANGRAVLYAGGTVAWLSAKDFDAALAETMNALAAAGVAPRSIPIFPAKLSGQARKPAASH